MFKRLLILTTLVLIISLVPLAVFAQGPDFSDSNKEVSQPYVFPGETVVFTLTVSNKGEDAPIVYMNDVLPPELELDVTSLSVTATYSSTYRLIWWSGPLSSNETVQITYRVTSTVKPGKSVRNTMAVGNALGGPGSTLIGTIGTGGSFNPDGATVIEAEVSGPFTIYLPVVFKNYAAP